MLLFILLCLGWYVSGAVSTIYWLTKGSDFNLSDVFPVLILGILGPSAWLMGYALLSDKEIVLIKRRKR